MARREVSRKFSYDDLPKRCFTAFGEMRSEKQLCDITISVGETSISAHRVILAAGIPYFRDIFSKCTDEVPDIEPNALACLIDYAYTHEVNINTDNVETLLVAACRLAVDEVKVACCDFLFDGLEPETAWNVRELAIRCNCSMLLEQVDFYISENFSVISKATDFLNYPVTYLKQLIDKDDLNVEDEKEVLDAVLRWVKLSPEDRKNELPELLCIIRMTLIQAVYLAHVVEAEVFIRESLSCRDLIDEAKHYNLFPEMKRAVCCFKTRPRRNRKEEYASQNHIENPCIYKFNATQVYSVQHFNFYQEKWVTGYSKIYGTSRGSTVHFKNMLYFFKQNTTLKYDPKDCSYELMCSMPTYRGYVGLAALGNMIYVCGGSTGSGKASNSVECFDPAADEWTKVKSLPTSRWGLSAVAFGEYVFTLGGKDNDNIFNSVERYDPKYDKWATMSSMLAKRSYAGTAILNGKIYVCGGRSPTGALVSGEVYDPIYNYWVFISPLNSARSFFSLLSYKGKLYAIGGEDEEENDIDTFDVYDCEVDKWTWGPSTDSTWYASGAVVMAAPNM